MGDERRQFERVPEALRTECRRLRVTWEHWREIHVLDFSIGGLRFESEEPYDVSETVALQIQLPGRPAPVLLSGQISWARRKPSGMTECGAAFTEMTPDQEADIDELIQFLKKRS